VDRRLSIEIILRSVEPTTPVETYRDVSMKKIQRLKLKTTISFLTLNTVTAAAAGVLQL